MEIPPPTIPFLPETMPIVHYATAPWWLVPLCLTANGLAIALNLYSAWKWFKMIREERKFEALVIETLDKAKATHTITQQNLDDLNDLRKRYGLPEYPPKSHIN